MRYPAVADQFYPGEPKELTTTLTRLFAPFASQSKEKAIAVVCPHAGYIYSGALAAETLAAVKIPETVVILGPNHRGQGAAVALSAISWDMPLGEVQIDTELGDLLLTHNEKIKPDDTAHRYEHSLEVQVPFLQMQQPRLRIVPLVISRLTYRECETIATSLAHAIDLYGKEVLILASSDMSHYESRQSAQAKDSKALKHIEEFDPHGLYKTVIESRISMCGVIPVVIALLTAKELGATRCRLVGYTDSGYTSGDTQQVVGYAGIVIS